MRIYTRTGDQGETSLFRGGRVSKDSARVEAFGSVDELNAHLGLIRAGLARAAELPESDRVRWISSLGRIQSWLFDAGSLLATPDAGRAKVAGPPADAVAELERAIDAMEEELPALRSFILPGGHTLGAQVHVARTVARRAERRVVALHRREPVPPALLTFLNRLSDYLFVLARAVNRSLGAAEEPWRPGGFASGSSTDSQA